MSNRVLIVDFGSQLTQLIARRVREAGFYSEIIPYNADAARFDDFGAAAVILSGGPASVLDDPAKFKIRTSAVDFLSLAKYGIARETVVKVRTALPAVISSLFVLYVPATRSLDPVAVPEI